MMIPTPICLIYSVFPLIWIHASSAAPQRRRSRTGLQGHRP